MDARLWFWCFALLVMAGVASLALWGMQLARRGRYASHRRAMLGATAGVVVFLLAYVVKRIALGPEDLSVWSAGARLNLRVHESFVALLLLAGGTALFLARRLSASRLLTGRDADPLPAPAARRRHRLAGRAAVVGAVLGFATACGILAGMLARAAG